MMIGWVALAAALPAAEPAAQAPRPRLVAQLGHSDWVLAMAFSPDGKYLLTAGEDYTARLWDVATGLEIHRLVGHTGTVGPVAYSPDGRWLLTVGENIRLWNAATGEQVHAFAGSTGTFTPDGRQVLVAAQGEPIAIFDAETGKRVRQIKAPSDMLMALAVSADAKRLLVATSDKDACLCDFATGKVVQTFRGHEQGEVDSVAFAPDGKRVLTASIDGTARLWAIATGKELRKFPKTPSRAGHLAAFSPDGKTLLTGSEGAAVLWDAETGKELRSYPVEADDRVESVAFSPDGRYVAVGQNRWVASLWYAATARRIRRFEGKAGALISLACSRDGRWLLTCDDGATAHLWDLTAGRLERRLPGLHGAFSADSRLLLIQGRDRTASLMEVATGQVKQHFSGFFAALSADGRTVATFDPPAATVRLWDAAAGTELRSFQEEEVKDLVFSPDGRSLVSVSYKPNFRLESSRITVWDVAMAAKTRSFVVPSASHVAFSPDGRSLALTAWNPRPVGKLQDYAVQVQEFATGKEIGWLAVHEDPILSIAVGPDGRTLLSGGFDRIPRLWEIASGHELQRLKGHLDWVMAVAFSPDGRLLWTASRDGTARLWKADSGQELCELIGFRDGGWAAVDPDGHFDASNGGDVKGLYWVVGNEPISLGQLKERYYEPGLLAKKLGFNKEPLRDVPAFQSVSLFPEAEAQPPAPGSTKLSVKLTNRGGGIGRVQVLVNGKEVLADARGPAPDPDAQQATVTVDLAGAPVIPGKPNRIQVVTWNKEGYLSSLGSGRGMELVWEPAGPADVAPIELYAVVAGISSYSSPAMKLRYAAKDAEDMAAALALGAKRLFGAERVHFTVLSSSGAPGTVLPTKANFRKAFQSVRASKPRDVLVVYLAGHGVAIAGPGNKSVYCYPTQEARTLDGQVLADPAVREQTCITSDELVEWTTPPGVLALNQVIILDTCAAAAAAGTLSEKRDVSADQVRALERLKDRAGFFVLMGCASDRVSYEAGQYGQGLLTYALLQGMKGAALRDDQYVDVSQLFQYARDQVPQLARNVGGVQQPRIAAPRADSFDVGLLTREDKAAIRLAAVRPRVLRPVLLDPQAGFDHLHLTALLRKQLNEESFAQERGAPGGPAIAYVDAEDLPGAVRPSGTYAVAEGKVRVKLVLIRDGQRVAQLEVEGSASDLPALVARLAVSIARAASAAGAPP